MADGELIAYSIASFICALFVLEYGADKFVDHTAVVAERTGVPQTVVALLTAGAEWEELAVVIFSIVQHRPSLALGNVIGSTISNILGAFSLGLLFHKSDEPIAFDRSSRLYTTLQLIIACLLSGVLAFGHKTKRRVIGGILIGLFVIYVASVLWAIRKGQLAAPELSDSDDSDEPDAEETATPATMRTSNRTGSFHAYGTFDASNNTTARRDTPSVCEPITKFQGNPLRPSSSSPTPSEVETSESHRLNPSYSRSHQSSAPLLETADDDSEHDSSRRSILYHLAYLLIGFVALTLSAYVLSHAASTLVTQLGVSDVLFGVVILSIATTLPEKFVAIISGGRGHAGIMVANTVGSNIFLLTLCMGVLWVSTGDGSDEGWVNDIEIGVMLGSSVFMTLAVWLGGKWVRYVGAVMLAAYIAFIVLEFALIRRP